MDWMDFDRNGVVDGRDFFILNEIIDPPKKKERYDDQIAELSKLLPKAKKKKLKGTLNMENFEEGQEKIIFELENNHKE